MISQISLVSIHLVIHQILSGINVAHSLRVTIYYESLCPYSTQFFINYFQPNYEKFDCAVEWILIPYGNARTIKDGSGRAAEIKCQHGQRECWGNKIQACALSKIIDKATQLSFCSCFMVHGSGPTALQQCQGNSDYTFLNICAEGDEGLQLLSALGDIEEQQQPHISGVPWLALDGKLLSQEKMDQMFNNFIPFICAHIDGQKPNVCSCHR